MADQGFDIQVHGFPQLVARIQTIQNDAMRWAKETAERAASAGARAMRNAAPEGDRDTYPPLSPRSNTIRTFEDPVRRPTLKQRIAADRGEATYHPGGAGGGGFWEKRFGVRGVGIRPLTHDPAFIITRGTGIYGPTGHHIRPGNIMTFMRGGKQIFTREVAGQPANDRWVQAGRHAARREVRRRQVEFDAAMRT